MGISPAFFIDARRQRSDDSLSPGRGVSFRAPAFVKEISMPMNLSYGGPQAALIAAASIYAQSAEGQELLAKKPLPKGQLAAEVAKLANEILNAAENAD